MISEKDFSGIGFKLGTTTDDGTMWFDRENTELNWNPKFPKWVEIDADEPPFGQFRGEIENKEQLKLILKMIKVI